jgi:hypothetical protein
MGEQQNQVVELQSRVAVDTFAGRIHVEWDPDAAVTPLGQLPFFIEFLKVSGLYDDFVTDCPLSYTSPNALLSGMFSGLWYWRFWPGTSGMPTSPPSAVIK